VVRFADTQPTRRIRTRKGQRHLPGRWWPATDGRHIGYESWLERDQLMWLDWDRAVPGPPPSRSGCGGQPKKASPGRTCRTTSLSAAVARPWWSTAGRRIGAVPGPGRVRGDPAGMRPGRLGVPAGRRSGPDRDGEPAVAVGVPAPALRRPADGCGAAGRVRCACPADGRRRGRVGYISQDGMRHQVSLADARAVRFEVMTPARRFAARKGQRHLPGFCGGHPRSPVTSTWTGRRMNLATKPSSFSFDVMSERGASGLVQRRDGGGVGGLGEQRLGLPAANPVGFQNSAAGPDLRFYAARSYSLMRPPRTGRRWIRSWERSATGWSGRGGRRWRLRWGRRPL
jgi:hypothetical protein